MDVRLGIKHGLAEMLIFYVDSAVFQDLIKRQNLSMSEKANFEVIVFHYRIQSSITGSQFVQHLLLNRQPVICHQLVVKLPNMYRNSEYHHTYILPYFSSKS